MQRLPLPPFDVPRTITMLTFTATPTPTADEAIGCHIHSKLKFIMEAMKEGRINSFYMSKGAA